MLTDACESERYSSNMEDIYEVNGDDSHIQDARDVMLTNSLFVDPLNSANFSNRKLFNDDRLQLLSISPPPSPSNFEYPVTDGI